MTARGSDALDARPEGVEPACGTDKPLPSRSLQPARCDYPRVRGGPWPAGRRDRAGCPAVVRAGHAVCLRKRRASVLPPGGSPGFAAHTTSRSAGRAASPSQFQLSGVRCNRRPHSVSQESAFSCSTQTVSGVESTRWQERASVEVTVTAGGFRRLATRFPMRLLLALAIAVTYVACDAECANLPSCDSLGYCTWGCSVSRACCEKDHGIWRRRVIHCFCGEEDSSSLSDAATSEN